jgi:hypothetical protein
VNIVQAVIHLFPDADPMQDFIVQDDSDGNGPYIAAWNLGDPQPTEAELQTAWEAYQQAEANKPPELTPLESMEAELTNTQLALTDTYEQLLASQDETTNVQIALVDVYEQLLAITDGGEANG